MEAETDAEAEVGDVEAGEAEASWAEIAEAGEVVEIQSPFHLNFPEAGT